MYSNDTPKLKKIEMIKTKDLIMLGILNAIYIVVIMLFGTVLGILPITYIFFPAIAAVPLGVIYMLMAAKIPRTGVFLISGLVQGAIMLVMGSFPTLIVCLVAGWIVAEILAYTGSYKSFWRAALGFVAVIAGYTIGGFAPIAVFTDSYLASANAMGYDMEYMASIVSLVSVPVLLLIIASGVVGALVGAYLGKKLLQKHFVKAGIV